MTTQPSHPFPSLACPHCGAAESVDASTYVNFDGIVRCARCRLDYRLITCDGAVIATLAAGTP